MAYNQMYNPYNTPPTSNNWWFGNNYSSGYSQASRSPMYSNPMMQPQMQQGPMPNSQMPMQQPAQSQLAPGFTNILSAMGPDSAESFRIGANSRVVLMDSNLPILYLKCSDDSGYSITEPYAIQKITMDQVRQMMQQEKTEEPTNEATSNFVTKADFDEFKNSMEDFKKMIEEVVMK